MYSLCYNSHLDAGGSSLTHYVVLIHDCPKVQNAISSL